MTGKLIEYCNVSTCQPTTGYTPESIILVNQNLRRPKRTQPTIFTFEPIYPVPQHAIMTKTFPIKYAIRAIPGFRPKATLADAV